MSAQSSSPLDSSVLSEATPLKTAVTDATLAETLIAQSDARGLALSQRLHKQVGGNLVACIALSEMIRQELSNSQDHSSIGRLAGQLEATLRGSIQDVREICEQQYPPILKAFGLNAALQDLVDRLATHFSGAVVLKSESDDFPMPALQLLNLYRLFEELLKHCMDDPQAEMIEILLRCEGRHVRLQVAYEGDLAHWDENHPQPRLKIIQRRCRLLGSHFEAVCSKPPSRDLRLSCAFDSLADLPLIVSGTK